MLNITPTTPLVPTPPTVYASALADADVQALLGAMATAINLAGLDQTINQRLSVTVIVTKTPAGWAGNFKAVQVATP